MYFQPTHLTCKKRYVPRLQVCEQTKALADYYDHVLLTKQKIQNQNQPRGQDVSEKFVNVTGS